MGKVKSAYEKAMEKAAGIGELTPEEKEAINDREKIKAILTAYYKGQIDPDGLWQKLKGSKPSLLRETQKYLVDFLGLGTTTEEFQQRKEGIVAIETLKVKQNVPAIEQTLNSIKAVQEEYQNGKERAEEELREAVESNPQMRLRPVRTPDGRTFLQAAYSVDEAVQAKLSEFMSQHEEQYNQKFARLIEKLKKEVSR
jgi:hypothetical protein